MRSARAHSVRPIGSRKTWRTTCAASGQFSRGPIFVLGDIRQAGDDYADRFLDAISGYKKPVFLELFDATPPGFFKRVARALPNFTVEISLESHDDDVRQAFGRPYTTQAIERTIDDALDAGCQRLDLFFMTGPARADLRVGHGHGGLLRAAPGALRGAGRNAA